MVADVPWTTEAKANGFDWHVRIRSSAMPRDRWGLRRTFRTPPGRSAISWRWEVGLPLFVMGCLTAVIAGYADGGGLLFWAAALIAGIGVAVFLSGMLWR